uniref:Uncharacterized protein n=1 Tax=Tanacetum cinerariifolium TaxID=118510 RepID=A0A6L2M3N0_TANCI|nr:hypothetical protein [Tanacetum cinerariifolium]
MALLNKDQLKFHSYQDVKLLMEAIEKRYGGNKESKKVQRTLLKQQYENFAASSSETLDQTFEGNYIPPKPDLMFIDERVKSKSVDVVSNVSSSAVKTVESKVKSINVKNKGVYNTVETKHVKKNKFSPPIIEDWISDDENEVEFKPKDEDKTVRPSVEKIRFVKPASEKVEKKKYKEKGVTDSGCSRHMIGNKCYLNDYEDYDGGFVSFGDGKGRISGKATKDETGRILKTFITGIENQLDCKVKVIRCDNGTKFKNSVMNQFCDMKGNKMEFSVAMTPQQNGVAKSKNITLIEAARTMALVIKPHNKTPYELICGRPPLLDFMKPFGCPVTILNTKDYLKKFDEKANEGFFIGYSVVSKAMRVFNKRTRIVEETLNIRFLENTPNVKGNRPYWLFDIDSLTMSMNYVPVVAGFQTNGIAGTKDNIIAGQAKKKKEPEKEYILIHICTTDPLISQGPKDSAVDAGKKATETKHINSTNSFNTVSLPVNTAGPSFINAASPSPINSAETPASTNAFEEHPFKRFSPFKNAFSLPHVPIVTPINDTGIFGNAYDDEAVEEEVDMNNVDSSYTILDAPLTKFLKDHPKDQVIGIQKLRRTNHKDFQNCLFACYVSRMEPKKLIQALKDPSWGEAMQDELLQFKLLKVWTLVDLTKDKWAIGTKWVFRNKKDERGIVVKNKSRLVTQGHTQEEGIDCDEVVAPVARIEAIRLFLSYTSFKDFVVYQMDVKSAFLYGKIEEEVYVCQPLGFEDLNFPDKVYKVEKALYGLHQAPRAWYETLSPYLMDNGLQVQQKSDGIFISQEKYVANILKKFDFTTVKTASTSIEPNKALVKDAEAEDAFDILEIHHLTWKPILIVIMLELALIGNPHHEMLWIQNQMLDYGFNFMNTKIYIDNESTIYIMKNLVFHSKTKHIENRHHLIRDSYKKKSIQVIKIYTDHNIPDLLIKAFDVNETVYKGWEYIMKRAATIASSLEVKQDSGNIHRTQSMATLNEPFPQRIGSGSGFRCQVTILWGAEAQTSAKTTVWNEFSSTMASAIICLANNQKFNFSKYMFDNMVKHLEGGVKFLMFLRFLQVFLDKQVIGMAKHKEIYVISSHTKKVFANMRRQGQGFFGNVTPLFETMMVNAQEKVGLYIDSHHTPTNTQPSSSKPQKKIKPKRKQRQAIHSPSSEIPIEESIPIPSNDSLPSGEDSIQLNEFMIFYTNLQQQVLDLEEAKTAQAKEIVNLKKRVKKLENRRKSRPTRLRRLKKIALIDEARGRMHDVDMFRVDDLKGNEVIIYVREKIVKREVSTADPVTTPGEVVTNASVEDSAAPTTATTVDVDDELTLAKTLIAIKAAKPKVISTTATIVTTAITTPRAKDIVLHEQVQAHIPTVSSSKDKGKAKMIEPEKPLKKKDQIALDEEVARKLEIEIKAKIEEEEMITREKMRQIKLKRTSKEKSFDDIKKMFDKVYQRVNTFVDMNTENVEESLKKTQTEEQGKVADDDTAELKRCLEIVLEYDDDVAIEATPLSSKSPTIIDYKIYREGKKSYFKIIRADGNSQNYLTFGTIFKNFNREDLEVLKSIVKEMFKKTKPVDDIDNLLFQTLKTMFEPHVEDII